MNASAFMLSECVSLEFQVLRFETKVMSVILFFSERKVPRTNYPQVTLNYDPLMPFQGP